MSAAYNPVIVDCLRILARRGRAIRLAQEAAAAGESLATDPATAADAALPDGTGRNAEYMPTDGSVKREVRI